MGTITSGALSPTLGYPIALAYLDAALAEPGTVVQVDIRGKQRAVRGHVGAVLPPQLSIASINHLGKDHHGRQRHSR